jgi:type III secretion protein T
LSALPSLAGHLAMHLPAAALYALRLLPTALLSPFLGGPLVPATVRLSLAAGLGLGLHLAAGGAPSLGSSLDLAAAALGELISGTALGLLSALPLEAARAGGRLADTLRGATLAELHVAPVRQRETAVGDLLAQWTVVLAGWAGADRLLLGAVLSTFSSLPVGRAPPAGTLLEVSLRGAAELLSAALCLGAPAAGGVLAAEVALGLAARAAPQLGISGAAQPARAAVGLLAVALSASALGGRLVATVALSADLAGRLGGGPP